MVFSLRFIGGCVSLATCILLLSPSSAFSQATPATQSILLPSSFSGWTRTGSTLTTADITNADVLAEYGLKDSADGTYRRGSNTLSLHAMRFADATGAYGAFTFYRKADMKPETLGKEGAANSGEVVFWSGVTVVDASFDNAGQNEVRSLRALVPLLPPTGGSNAVAPTLPQYLPQSGLQPTSVRYAIGPIAYTRMGGVLPPNLIDFSRDAEAVTAEYRLGNGILTILEYPTPQMALNRAEAIHAMLNGPLPPALQKGNPALAVTRSGPLVIFTSGDMSFEQAHTLLNSVKYQADVTWSRGEGNGTGEVRNAAKMLIGIGYLTGILAAFAVLSGVFLGGGRALLRTVQGKPISTVYEEDFISLNLNEEPRKSPHTLP